MRYWLVFAAVVAAGILMAGMALAQSPPRCGPAEALTKILTEKYGETVRVVGLNTSGAVLEFWGGDDNGTWSVFSRKGDVACLVATGQSWSGLLNPEPVLKGEDS